MMATETLDTPTNGSTSNGTGETNPPEDCANVSHSSPDAKPVGDGEQGEKRKKTESETVEKTTSVHPLSKTSLCSYFRRTGGECSHGETCRYAHGEEELRPRPDNTWDPTSERAKKLKLENEDRDKADERDDEVMMTETISEDGCSESALDKCLVNLPMKWSSDNLRNFLNEQGIEYKSAKTKKGMIVGFVTFETTEQVKAAIEKLQGKPFGTRTLKIADVIPRSFDRNVKPKMVSDNSDTSEPANEVEDGDSVNDSSTPGSSVLKGRSAREVVTPLAHMSYKDQLEHKKTSLSQTMKKLTRNARKACPNGVSLPDWILKSREIGGLPCKLEGIIESPLVNGYRNKCEFSVGYSLQGKPTVGFSLGNFREGVTAVEEPLDCPNVSRIGCKYAEIFQKFLESSTFPIWNRMNNTGFWRQLTVREGRTPGKIAEVESGESNVSEVLLMVQICSKDIDDEAINVELEKMAEAFVMGASTNSPSLPLTVLVVQDHQGISNVAPADAPLRHLSLTKGESRLMEDSEIVAEARIQDYINNLRFFISPTAFFQVNTLAAEKLYSLAGDWANLGPNTLLFDVCCGTGTIGLTLAHRVGMVVGIEMNASAVADANQNAEINGIKNCRFVCSKAEDVMGLLLKEYLIKKVDNQFDSGINDSDVGIKEEASASEDKAVDGVELKDENKDIKEGIKEVKKEEENNCDTENSNNKMHFFEGIKEVKKEEESNCVDENNNNKMHCFEGIKEVKKEEESDCVNENNNEKRMHYFENVVAIVDPPRVGLHPTVIKALRTHSRLRRLVYISCNPESLMANAIELCTPSADNNEKGNKNNRGWRNMSSAGLARHRAKSMPTSEPFHPVKAMAVDLFPHTPHCELVMLLERILKGGHG